MTCLGRRSILNKTRIVLTVWAVVWTMALAQHPVAPVAHPPMAPVHVSPPPVYHPPVMQTPTMRPPVHYPPVYTPPQTGIVRTPGALGTSVILPPVRPVRPIRPTLPIVLVYSPQFFFGDPFWRFNACWSASCEFFWPWPLGYTNVYSPSPVNYVAQAPQTPLYVYGGEREDFPQLFLKDGTLLNVTDYWVVDGQLHFKVMEAIDQKPVEHSIPFDELDLQKTVDANTARGFRFVLRNAPYEDYLRDHPQGPPPALATPHP